MKLFRLIAPLAIVAFLGGTLTACKAEVRHNPPTGADMLALLVLEGAYIDARSTLTERLDSFPTESGLALLALQERSDALVEDFKKAWNSPVTLEQIDVLMARTAMLYEEGKTIVKPLMATLTPQEQLQLTRLNTTWTQVNTAYRNWLTDPAAQERRDMIRAGMELATAVLLVLG